MQNRPVVLFLIFSIPLLLAGTCRQPPPAPPDAGLYHTNDEIIDELRRLQSQFPDIAHVTELGESLEGRKIMAIKISGSPGTEEEEPEVIFVGGHHAREWISVDVPFLLAKRLLKNYATDAATRSLVDGGSIWIIPLLNPDGHQYSVDSNRLWRKNRRNNGDGTFGVDLNRNYSFQWGGPGSSGDTFSETYRGPQAFSEPETRILRDLVAAHNFQAIISYHSYSQLVLFPWGYTRSPAPDAVLLQQLATSIADSIFSIHRQRYTPEQSSDLYVASGDATDWLYGNARVPSFTIELRPGSSSPGFILPESEIQPTFEENLPAALFLIKWTQTLGQTTITM